MTTHQLLPLTLALASAAVAADLPTDWIDADTGHRVIRLSREDGTQSLYFNQNAYTADGKKLIVTTAGGGISTIILATREIKPLVAGPVSVLVAGHKSGDVYYRRVGGGGYGRNPNRVYATNADTGATREVVTLPVGRSVTSLAKGLGDGSCCLLPELAVFRRFVAQLFTPTLLAAVNDAEDGDLRTDL